MIVSIIGIGLIGGSLAISLKESGYADKIIGVDINQDNLDKAIRRRLIDEDMLLKEAVEQSDIIIVATPVNAMVDILNDVLNIVDKQVVMEVGSTKIEILNKLRKHPKRARFIATHPMAGTEYSGPEAAIPNLFNQKSTVLIEVENSDEDVVMAVKDLYRKIGMNITYMNAHEHDMHTAYVSHISHISSFALALTVLEKEQNENRIFELASGGFRSTVRLAKSSADMWIPVFQQNRNNVLDVLDEHINQLAKFRSLLIKKDFKTFYEQIEKANKIQKIIDT